jgi:poly-gamma-glutamate capsule biosynthesis protein CapA/YwtB (metallophosphatase superfamily)
MSAVELLFTGDLVLDVPEPDHWLSGIAPATQSAQLTIGHLEVPHTSRCTELKADVPAPGAEPSHLEALRRAGFDAVTLAGNHITDCGPEGIADTREVLEKLGIRYCGAGEDLATARAPALLRAAGKRVAVLSYNCVGPEAGWAQAHRAGCAYVRIETADGSPIAPAAPLTLAQPGAFELLEQDVAAAARHSDLVVVALHKGIVHTPARLAPYERQVAHAAIDAGAALVVSHHAHIVRGIEFYRDQPIYHGLGNGCVVTRALSPDQTHPGRSEWVRRRKQLFGFEPNPAYTLAPFHPDAIHSFLGRVLCHDDGRIEAGIIPVYVEPPGRPVLADLTFGKRVTDYLVRITASAGLPAISTLRRSDMVLVS